MRQFRILALLILPCVLLTLCGSFFLRTERANAAPAACDTWRVVSGPHNGLDGEVLQAVAASAENNVWAVGYHYTGIGNQQRTFSEYWNGTAWKIVPMPNAGSSTAYDVLNGVVAISNSNVWAVGGYWPSGPGAGLTLIENWNGQAWSIIPSPNIGTIDSKLNGIAAVSSNDIWAVGIYWTGNSTYANLIEHWDGTSWSVVSSPNIGQSEFYGITALSTNDVWIVGSAGSVPGAQPLTEHWDGSSWNVVNSPGVGQGNSLNSITPIPGTNDLLAVGYDDGYPQLGSSLPLIEQWNGNNWSIVSSPNPPMAGDSLIGVAAISANNAWAIGFTGYLQTLIEHWDGTSWSIVPSPDPSRIVNVLNGATIIPGKTKVWAVGYVQGNKAPRTLTEVNC